MRRMPRPRRAGPLRSVCYRWTGLAALAATSACGPGEPTALGSPSAAPRGVVVLVLDALHADELSCYGGPARTRNIDLVAARGTRFARALSNSTWTLPSTASLFTGELQERHGVTSRERALPDDAHTLSEAFRDAGYETAAIVQMPYASPAFGFGQGFGEFELVGLEPAGGAASGGQDPIGEEDTIPWAKQWIKEHDGRRFFLYVHLRRPHSPYRPLADFLAPLEAGCALASTGSEDPRLAQADVLGESRLSADERAHVEHLYRANLLQQDVQIGPLVGAAAARPDVLLVLTSDHGEGLGQHGYYGHGERLHAENLDVPLIFAGAGVARGVDRDPASTVDLFPTLAELCGLAPPAEADGASLAARLRADRLVEPPGDVFASAKHGGVAPPDAALVRGRLKLVLRGDGTLALFDVLADRTESRDLAALQPGLAAELAAAARARRALLLEAAAEPAAAALVPGLEARLGDLGYAR
jgi:arylsulfatase A-like enzyme